MPVEPEIVKNFITWTLVMAGWYVVARQNARRDRRSEIRDLVSQAQSLVAILEKKGRDYWTIAEAHPDAKRIAHEIKLDLAQLSRHVNILAKQDNRLSSLVALKNFRRALTGGEFEAIGRSAVVITDLTVMEIAVQAVTLATELEDGFENVYCS